MADAGLGTDDIDRIISAAAVPYQPIPATAPAIQPALGIADGRCFATDINCSCLGFAAAPHFADPLLTAGGYANILVVSAEIASRGLRWQAQPAVADLFGDGAGAAVVSLRPGIGLRAAHFVTHASAYVACQFGAGGTRFDFEHEAANFALNSKFTMDGKELFKVTARHLGPFVGAFLARADTDRRDIACVIAHQASPGALEHMIRIFGFAPGQVVNIAAEYGNQIATSIPSTLDHVRKSGRIGHGDRIMILGTSSGVSFGGQVLDV